MRQVCVRVKEYDADTPTEDEKGGEDLVLRDQNR
jgi:hypothetical protein